MTNFNFSNPFGPLKRANAIQVPLFDPPYKQIWTSGSGFTQRAQGIGQSLVYSYNNVNGASFRAAILAPTHVNTFEVGALANLTPAGTLVSYGSLAVAIEGQPGPGPSYIYQFPLVPGGSNLSFTRYNMSTPTSPLNGGSFQFSGWARQTAGPIFPVWYSGLSLFNYAPANGSAIRPVDSYLVSLFNAGIPPLINAAPSMPTANYGLLSSFQWGNTKQGNFTFALGYSTQSGTVGFFVMPLMFNSFGQIASTQAFWLQSDNTTLNTDIFNNKNNCAFSVSEYGILFWYMNTSGPVFFNSQPFQIILVALENSSQTVTGQWAPIQLMPQTSLARTAVSLNQLPAAMQIDANGIFYFDTGYQPAGWNLYVANSFGQNISIPTVPLLPLNNGIPLQAYCPCSPVAIGGNP